MDIKIAEHSGFCFGVKNAVTSVHKLISDGKYGKIVTLGPIIHNEQVVKELEELGVCSIDSIDDADPGTTVVIRSHGVPKEIFEKLEKKGISYIDSTCPFVSKIHKTVEEASEAGNEIVILGQADHPEVIGILGWSKTGGTVIETPDEAEAFVPENPHKTVCVVAQTTLNYKKFQDYVEIFEKKEYDINVVDTICHATLHRQEEAAALSEESDAMIVIGSQMSSNSRKLYDICKERCENTFFIQNADSVGDIDLSGAASLGITAGASTPNTLIQEVFKACQKK
ncbi:MAG: 4-hydroxy-3-methylbut-2-enyl diphosphate reductase [Eubacterium sp.]|nr:4-hydroxy-3-methylbut-2-enyl diphosphate reductase [Eubacterium sp.]